MARRSFDRLTSRGQYQRLREVARTVLAAHGIAVDRLTVAGASFNTVFHAVAVDGRELAVRVGAAERIHPLGSEDAEAAWLDELADAGAPVNRALRTPDGAAAVTVAHDDVTTPRTCMVFDWTPGTMVKARITPGRLQQAGSLCALLHELGSRGAPAAPPPGVPVGDHLVYFTVSDRLADLRAEYGTLFDDARERAEAGLARVWREHGAAAHLVHGDLTPANMVVHCGVVTAIDFQDMLWAPEVQDLAMVVAVLRRDPQLADLHTAAFRRGYEQRRRWPDVDDTDFEDLVAIRRLSITNLNAALRWPNSPMSIARHAEMVRDYLRSR